MPITADEAAKIKDTGIVLSAVNLLLWPVYYVDKRLGVASSVIATLAAAGLLHQLGQSERDKRQSNSSGFFSRQNNDSPSGDLIKKDFDNLIEGGSKAVKMFTNGSGPT